MKRQTKATQQVLTEEELHVLQVRIEDCLDRLINLRIPDALGHLDPNPGNIILSTEGCTFLDWAEAYVGNPFFTFQYLLEHLRRRTHKDPSAESRLSNTYIQEWQSVLSSSVINECLQLTSLIAVFAFAVGTKTWKDPETLKNSTRAGFVRSLVRRMFREANELNSRTLVCLC